MNRWTEVAQTALAGALTGFLIGPGSLDEFFGLAFYNSVAFNIATGTAVGAVLGFLATLSKQQAE